MVIRNDTGKTLEGIPNPLVRLLLVELHQPRRADDIGMQDYRELAAQMSATHLPPCQINQAP